MPLQCRTRSMLALMAGLPVAFLVVYPLVFGLLPTRWQEWADLPRDWMVFVMVECAAIGLIAITARVWCWRGK